MYNFTQTKLENVFKIRKNWLILEHPKANIKSFGVAFKAFYKTGHTVSIVGCSDLITQSTALQNAKHNFSTVDILIITPENKFIEFGFVKYHEFIKIVRTIEENKSNELFKFKQIRKTVKN